MAQEGSSSNKFKTLAIVLAVLLLATLGTLIFLLMRSNNYDCTSAKCPKAKDSLKGGFSCNTTDAIMVSPDGNTKLYLDPSGKLVIKTNDVMVWESATSTVTSPTLTFDRNGTLTVSDSTKVNTLNSKVGSKCPAKMILGDNASLKIEDADGTSLWAR